MVRVLLFNSCSIQRRWWEVSLGISLRQRSRLVWVPCIRPHDMLEILPTVRLGHHVLRMLNLIALKSVLAVGVLFLRGQFHERRLVVNVYTSMV
jgi:hypothetical protein